MDKPRWISEAPWSSDVIECDVPRHMLAVEYEVVPWAAGLCMARDLIQDLYMVVPVPDKPWKLSAGNILMDEPWMVLSYDILVCGLQLLLYTLTSWTTILSDSICSQWTLWLCQGICCCGGSQSWIPAPTHAIEEFAVTGNRSSRIMGWDSFSLASQWEVGESWSQVSLHASP